MQCLDFFPEKCRCSIKTVADELKTDYETAYAMLSLQALLYDLYPSDTVVVSMVLRGKDKQDVDKMQS